MITPLGGLKIERLALKKSSNVKIFEKIQIALKKEFQARKMEVKDFSVEQLRSKYKWFKREWKHIQNKIKFGSGLSSKETDPESESTRWYDILNPVFTEGVDDFTDVARSAGDIADESSISSAVSVHASSGEGEMGHSSSDESCDEERSTTSVPSQSLPPSSQQYYPFQEQRRHSPSLLAFTSVTSHVSPQPQHGLYSMPSETDSTCYYSSTSPDGISGYTQLN